MAASSLGSQLQRSDAPKGRPAQAESPDNLEKEHTMSDKKTITFTLETPVEHDGQTYTTLTLRKMKAKDLVAADLVNGNLRKSLAIFASMAGVPIMVMEELDTDDFNRLGREAAPLMGKLAVKAMAKLEREEAGNPPLQ